VLFRLLTPRDKKYHDAVKAYEPYNKLVQPLPDMRDQTVRIVKAAITQGRRAYVLTNNRSEGNAPGTTKALADMLRAVGSLRRLTMKYSERLLRLFGSGWVSTNMLS
jgi:hypothetical protein